METSRGEIPGPRRLQERYVQFDQIHAIRRRRRRWPKEVVRVRNAHGTQPMASRAHWHLETPPPAWAKEPLSHLDERCYLRCNRADCSSSRPFENALAGRDLRPKNTLHYAQIHGRQI